METNNTVKMLNQKERMKNVYKIFKRYLFVDIYVLNINSCYNFECR